MWAVVFAEQLGVPLALQIKPDAYPNFPIGHNRILFRNLLHLHVLVGRALGTG
jgi:hypothetical protein